MTLRKRALLFGIIATLFIPTVLAVSGCSSGNTVHEDPAATKQRVDAVQQEQDIINRSNGTYDSLSAQDKEALVKLVGTEANAKEAFNHMHPQGPGAASAAQGGGLPAHGPNTTGG